ncbi:uncharacterized protein LOC108677171, partial [Hyalella azteca]|uniref:Uncharacterized protein LOC108677171 n=1 Tax=Hyalella azteca TaxID=294128 RepID=A0A8B7P446_HYAAZ
VSLEQASINSPGAACNQGMVAGPLGLHWSCTTNTSGGMAGTSGASQTCYFCPQTDDKMGVLLHAQQCQMDENCGVQNCQSTKSLLDHLSTCRGEKTCIVARCVGAKKILSQYNSGGWQRA